MRNTTRLAVAFCSSVVAMSSAHALDWRDYSNARFGIEMRYPADVFSAMKASESGDANLFATPDGRAKLLVGAFENSGRYSPAEYQKFIARTSFPGLRVDYAPVGHTWAVLSGTLGGKMIYEKVMFRCDGRVINSFALVYPIDERSFYDPLVERIEDSFRPGNFECKHYGSAF